MTRPALGTALRVLAPLLAGAAAGIALQAVAPDVRLYVAASPGLTAALTGLAVTGILVIAARVRKRIANVTDEALRRAAAEGMRDRLRFLMRLDHELKNPLTAIRAGLANVDLA